jgi:c-di-GMP-related signal transduction protein
MAFRCALVRAAFCEGLAQLSGAGARKSELFLMGMFSLLDAMMGCPLEDALRQLPLPADIHATLLGQQPPGQLTTIYRLTLAHEQGEWQQVVKEARRLQLEGDEIRGNYLRAVTWFEEIFRLLPELAGLGTGGLGPSAKGPLVVREVKNAPAYSHR